MQRKSTAPFVYGFCRSFKVILKMRELKVNYDCEPALYLVK